ncbi:hypothetical protein EYF80_056028 [Liparis tanakae]|uniref:Uncharacterized protein n=1 Tax=Liparis tanakae TaxID=230148 RepID=A0A4Z2EY74_9TELE|nr:hypothetical protein EYF80_056028 [Liparis tanakae]
MDSGLWATLRDVLIRHCAFLTGRPGTCSTSLQNISGPRTPQVALADMSAMDARFNTAGKSPGEETQAAGLVPTSERRMD